MVSHAIFVAISVHICAQLPIVSALLENSTECVDVHFMVARGSLSAYPGFPYDVFESVAANMTTTTNYEDIIYPATNETETDSYFVGRAAAGAQVNAYAEACPDSKIVLGSYSQGCLIVGDALAGGGGQEYLGNATQPLISEEIGKKIIANIFFGNPRHVPYESYDFGDHPWNATGKYPRLPYQVQNLDTRYGDIIGDWCNYGDSVCSPAVGDFLALHTAYDADYSTVAAEWTLAKIGKYAYTNTTKS
ncbi:family 5 carbohydrate esterase [Cryphonectria parasitica EP155]|uniref:Family 5 carbohydrate esterase n=1 Tax=Cryphonectria parasitica (strain ATCC 38755 / EP155) TaxID=660469 RepID=A0A9P4Y724_CRYP1|nr:family 5 carbohydrate esterase [Cryphonectria parasitica EP155]KAF3768144.1 family 5 carbohydrate esterase [Cryphonectria parasitica EP155]